MLSVQQAMAAELTGADVLEILKANDAQFSNVLAEYDYTLYEWPSKPKRPKYGKVRVAVSEGVDRNTLPTDARLVELFNTYVAGKEDRSPLSPEEKECVEMFEDGRIKFKASKLPPEKIEPTITKSRNRLGFRWPDLVVHKQYTPDRWSKYGALGNQTHLVYPMTTPSSPREWFHHTALSSSFPNVYHATGKWFQITLGFGYSEIIKEVTSYEKKEGSHFITVTLDWWSKMSGEGKLQLDEFFVVRDADLTFETSHVLVSTSGDYRDPERRFVSAKKGTFEQFRGTRCTKNFDVFLRNLKFGMTDAEFDQLADMSTPLDEARHEEDIRGRIREVHLVPPGKALTTVISENRWLTILTNLVVICVLAYLALRSRRALSQK